VESGHPSAVQINPQQGRSTGQRRPIPHAAFVLDPEGNEIEGVLRGGD
jgi:hypothetical protein